MRRALVPLLTFGVLITAFSPLAFSQEADLLQSAKMATVFVAKFDAQGRFMGWGSGFFVDEGIVVTNKHVVEGGRYFKVFSTEANDTVNLDCSKELGLADVKINLDDDAAYIRVFLDCPHDIVRFVDNDPNVGDTISVLGYPSRGTMAESLSLSLVSGSVTGTTDDGWLTTDAELHAGNSGGPVISNGKVAGVAVAKSVDANGNYLRGYFVPSSIVLRGLLYANNSTFGYTSQGQVNSGASSSAYPYGEAGKPFNPLRLTSNASNGDCRQSLGEGGEAIGYGGCQCKGSYHRNADNTACLPGQEGLENPIVLRPQSMPPPRSFSSSSRSSSSRQQSSAHTPFQARTCTRVMKWFADNAKILDRVNDRLQKRFGFTCGG